MTVNWRRLIRLGFYKSLSRHQRGKKISFSYRKLVSETHPHCRLLFSSPVPYVSHPLSPPYFTLFPAPAISLTLTDTAGRAGLPVVSIFHLDAGDSALPLQFITWITRKGHRVARLPTFPISTAIHGNTRISAGCGQWTWRANTNTHTHWHTWPPAVHECHLQEVSYAADSCQTEVKRRSTKQVTNWIN